MSKVDIIRAWKDQEYRSTLSADQLASLPQSPVGMIELSDEDLGRANGAAGGFGSLATMACCTLATRNCDSICQQFSC